MSVLLASIIHCQDYEAYDSAYDKEENSAQRIDVHVTAEKDAEKTDSQECCQAPASALDESRSISLHVT